jgi:hypothetical protein
VFAERMEGRTPPAVRPRQEITINVLTDGGEPSLACRSPLIDVQVRQCAEGSRPTTVAVAVAVATTRTGRVAATAVTVGVVATAAAAEAARKGRR